MKGTAAVLQIYVEPQGQQGLSVNWVGAHESGVPKRAP
jgi:hypothetical protein